MTYSRYFVATNICASLVTLGLAIGFAGCSNSNPSNSNSNGGSIGTGGIAGGGKVASGGASTTLGGAKSSGGTSSVGTDSNVGGVPASGGMATTGGAKAVGGMTGAGGMTPSGGMTSPSTMMSGGMTSPGTMMPSGGMMAATGGASAVAGGKLVLSLDASIDGDDGVSKATSLMSADLLDSNGTKVAGATISAGNATISLGGLVAGDYFIRVNGDADDLVPTRIDDPSKDIAQRVGEKLRASYIGPSATPVYRINTYSAGQAMPEVVQYSDGTPISGEQPYVILTFATPNIEFRVLGSGKLLTSVAPQALHASADQPFDSWLLNTTGLDHHGDMFMGDAGTNDCSTCHKNMDTKPAAHSAILSKSGWCFQCHSGSTGSGAGFVDPTR